MFDVIVVGGGPAGLSAALMLGRCRRRVLVCDLGQPRNRQSRALHGYLTRDGIAPADMTEIGRRELHRYGVECRAVGVTGACWTGDRFHVSLSDRREEDSRFLLLATGVVDDLPLVPGFEACYGRSVFHCPYCDGWEWRDRRLAAYGRGAAAVGLALGLKTWSESVVLCADGTTPRRADLARLSRNQIEVERTPIAELLHEDGALRKIRFEDGRSRPIDALFFSAGQHPQSDIAVSLGCTLTKRGTVKTGMLSDTNVPRVFVAGDASRDAQFAIVAAAEGVKAAVAINHAMQRAELGS
jgi:thioredoxin reductase